MTDLLLSPSAERNKQPILAVLQTALPATGRALEIASGTGQHAAWFAAGLPGWQWQPTERDADALEPMERFIEQAHVINVSRPLRLDVMGAEWFSIDATDSSAARFDAIFCANMLHISPWATCAALMQGAGRHLARDGVVITYGPYLEDDVATSPGNVAFDQSLRARNPEWGIRRREDVAKEASRAGLELTARHAMPANNLLLAWSRGPDGFFEAPP